MEYIKYFDSFGIKFHFYTNNQPNHQNIFGGIMTILYIIICIVIFIGFSYEDIFRLNPISSKSEITDIEPKKINIRKENIWIPFRLVNDENQFVDHRDLLYVYPYLVEGNYNDKMGMKLNYHLLNYKLCNKTTMGHKPDNYKIDVPLNELFCIEQDDIPFGGNWNGDYISYIEIDLFLCDEGIYYNQSDSRCNKINNLFNKSNSALSFDFYYPVVQFQPTNYKKPISIIYKNNFYRLSAYSHKLEKIYIQEHKLSDDKNIIISDIKNTSCWGISSMYGDDYYIPKEKDPMIHEEENEIYTLEIYMDYGMVYYKRTYNKIFTILSKVFPLFKFTLYFIKKFTQHIKISLTKRQLAELIFERREQKKINKNDNSSNYQSINKLNVVSKVNDSHSELIKGKKFNNNSNYNNSNYNNSNYNNSNYNNSNKIDIIKMNSGHIQKKLSLNNNKEKHKENNNISSNLNNGSYIPISNKHQNAIKILNHNDISLINSRRKSLIINESFKSKDISTDSNIKANRFNKRDTLFPYSYFFMDFFFDKLINPQKFFCVSKKYFTVYNFMCQIYDISTHIILFKHFNLLNNILKEMIHEHGFRPFHSFNKININDDDLIKKINKDLITKKSILFSKNFSFY